MSFLSSRHTWLGAWWKWLLVPHWYLATLSPMPAFIPVSSLMPICFSSHQMIFPSSKMLPRSNLGFFSNIPLNTQASISGFPGWLSGKESACQCMRCNFNSWVGKIPRRRKWQLTPVFLLGKFCGQRRLVDYSPWGHRVRHDWACMHTSVSVSTCVLNLSTLLHPYFCYLSPSLSFNINTTTVLVLLFSDLHGSNLDAHQQMNG